MHIPRLCFLRYILAFLRNDTKPFPSGLRSPIPGSCESRQVKIGINSRFSKVFSCKVTGYFYKLEQHNIFTRYLSRHNTRHPRLLGKNQRDLSTRNRRFHSPGMAFSCKRKTGIFRKRIFPSKKHPPSKERISSKHRNFQRRCLFHPDRRDQLYLL